MKLQAAFVLMLFGILVPSCSQLIADHKEGELIPETSEAVMSYAFLAGTDRLSRSEKSAIIDFLARQNLTDRDLLIATIPNPGEPARLEIRSDEIHQLLSRYPARIRFSASARIQGTDPHPVENGILRVSRVHSLKPNCRVDQGESGCANLYNLAQMIAVPSDRLLPLKGRRYHTPAPESPPLANLTGVIE